MKNISMFKVIALAISLLLSTSPLDAWAETDSPDVLAADAIQSGCSLMVSRYGYDQNSIDNYKLSLNWRCSGRDPYIIDTYETSYGTPEVVTVFYTKNRDVVALLRWWSKDSKVVRYKVFAYRYVGDVSDTAFVRLDRLSEQFGDGFDGIVNGKHVEYPFKTAAAIRKQLAVLGQ